MSGANINPISDDDLVLYHYRDGLDAKALAAIAAALDESAALRARYSAIEQALETQVLPRLKASAGITALRRHLLASGDPTRWNTVDGVDNAVRGDVYSVALQASWQTLAQAEAAITALQPSSDSLLRRLAAESGGRYYRVRHSDDLGPILTDIEQLEKVSIRLNRIGEHADWYWLPLAAGLALLMLAQRRGLREVLP